MELGADVFHTQNLLFYNLAQKYNLSIEFKEDSKSRAFGLWDGEQFRFKSSTYRLLTLAHLIWRYGLDYFKMAPFANDIVSSSWQKLYDDPAPWVDMSDFFSRYNSEGVFAQRLISLDTTLNLYWT